MCGITGIFNTSDQTTTDLKSVIQSMTDAIQRRGPDFGDVWVDDANTIAFGHRRLSILDLSEHGNQPKSSNNGRFIITYNGEIYNYLELKEKLEKKGHEFRTTSDTEVLLTHLEEEGVKNTLKELNGMFAFGLWDKKEQKLYIARDRLGKKPLYYGFIKGQFVFASELKSITKHPDFEPRINKTALGYFLQYNFIPAPYCIYEGIHKLPAASYSCLETSHSKQIEIEKFWDFENIIEKRELSNKSYDDHLNELDAILNNAVKIRMASDVPLGCFLSGGIDSSIVAAYMQKNNPRPVKTFSIGFKEDAYNESQYAKAIAAHLQTDHKELFVTSQDALDIIPDLSDIYDEPFADPSQIPTHLLSKLARKDVTVALSGDGGDETFCGYERYFYFNKIHKGFYPVAKSMLSMGMSLIKKHKFQKGAFAFQSTNDNEFYARLMMNWPNQNLINGNHNHMAKERYGYPSEVQTPNNFVETMMAGDTLSYLPEDILTKVDRASMYASLEARAPLLDYRLIEYAWSMPLNHKYKNSIGKAPLRDLLEKHVPKRYFDRPKQGFGIPIDEWLRGPLREWAEELINTDRLAQQDVLDPGQIDAIWQKHISGKQNCGYALWPVLMFQSWYDRWMK